MNADGWRRIMTNNDWVRGGGPSDPLTPFSLRSVSSSVNRQPPSGTGVQIRSSSNVHWPQRVWRMRKVPPFLRDIWNSSPWSSWLCQEWSAACSSPTKLRASIRINVLRSVVSCPSYVSQLYSFMEKVTISFWIRVMYFCSLLKFIGKMSLATPLHCRKPYWLHQHRHAKARVGDNAFGFAGTHVGCDDGCLDEWSDFYLQQCLHIVHARCVQDDAP